MKTFPGYTDLFMSPVTGLIYIPNKQTLTTDYVWVGNFNNVAIESPILKDIRLDIAQIRNKLGNTSFILKEATPWFDNAQALNEVANGLIANLDGLIVQATLAQGNLWIGDVNNLPQPNPTIQLGNMPDLTQNYFWMGDASNRPIEINTLPIGTLPDLPYQNIWVGNISNRPTPTQRIDNLNLPPFITANVANNLGIYNLYTGGTINTAHPIDDPGPVATTTLRVDMSNLPNLGKGKIWMGVVNYTPPVITIDTTFPFFHVTGSLNWDIRGLAFTSYAVPTETGLDPGTIFYGDFDHPGQIIQVGLPAGYMFIGNDFGQIIGTTLNPGNIFIGSNASKIIQTGLTWGQIFIGDSTNKVTQQGLLAHELWTGLSDGSGRMVATIVLNIVNLPNLTFNKVWVGDNTNRPVEGNLPIEGLPDLTFQNLWIGDNMNRPAESPTIEVNNLPNLLLNRFWLGNGSSRPVAVAFNIQTGTGLTGGPITNGSGTISIADTGVLAGTYPYSTVTVNLQGQLTSASSNLATIEEIQTNISTLNTQVETLQGQVSAIEADIAAINASLAALTADIAAINVTLVGIAGEIAAINITLAAHDVSIVGLVASVAVLQAQVIGIFTRLDGLESRVATLEDKVSQLITSVAILASQVADIYSKINDINSLIGELIQQYGIIFTDLYSRVDTLDSQVLAIQGQITAILAAIAALRLNNIVADADVSFYNYKLINLGDPVNPTDGVNLQTLQSYVGGLPLTLAGFVTGGPAVGGVLTASRGPTCTLDVIPAAANVSFGNFAAYNIAPIPDNIYTNYLSGQAINFDWFLKFLNNQQMIAGFAPDYIFPTVNLTGQTQNFQFQKYQLLSRFQIQNLSIPQNTSLSQNCLELLNGNSSGFRFRQVTSPASTSGKLIVEKFSNDNIPGTSLIEFSENNEINFNENLNMQGNAVYDLEDIPQDLYNGYLQGQAINIDWFRSFLNNEVI